MPERHDTLGYGLIGAGAFGQFCIEQYRQLDSIKPIALVDRDRQTAEQAAARFGMRACGSVDELLARDDVGLVHIATPPNTHADLADRALRAGKHVLCEKPLTMNVNEARRLVALAEQQGKVLAANLIMRYNPLCEAVKRITEAQLLGQPLHGYFENYAKDEPLGPDHWFWQRDVSGGIFVEHGVHFFDLFEWWLGEGQVVAAQHCRRAGGPIVDQVNATVRYGDGALVNFYHGFTQPTRLDRQQMRLLFEHGSVTLDEWVPTSITVEVFAEQAQLDRITSLLPLPEVQPIASYASDERKGNSRHKPYTVDGYWRVTSQAGMNKPALYGHVLRELMADQLEAIADPTHLRRVTEVNGLRSVQTAVHATALADASA